MLDFYEKRKLKAWLYSKPTALLLLIVIGFLLTRVWDVYQTERITAAKRAEYTKERDELKGRADALQEEIDHLSTEYGVEAEIREKFEVNKEGERVLIILDNDREDAPEAAAEEEKGFWKSVTSFFKREG